jgi:hypothetical protein
MILGGGALLWIVARTDWATMFGTMAALLAITILPVLWLVEPPPAAPQARMTMREVALDRARRLRLPGMGAFVALFTLMMDASDPEHASTDYTLCACAIVFAMGLANFMSATLADAFGYAPTFVAGCVLSFAGCLVLVRSLDAQRSPSRLQPVWQTA